MAGLENSQNQEPLGLTQLRPLSHLSVRQNVFSHKYSLHSPEGALIMYAKEDTPTLSKLLVHGKERAFNINVFDTQDQEIISIRRPYTFGLDKMEVKLCGRVVSIVRQETTFFKPVLRINDADDQPAFRIKGPPGITGECDFKLQTASKQTIGVIRKKWRDLGKSPTADLFHIHFPSDLDVTYKAAVISACFLIDFLHYDS